MPNTDLFAIDGGYRSLPACQGFLEGNINLVPDVVAIAFEEGVIFLYQMR